LEGGSWKAAGRSRELLTEGAGVIPGTEAEETVRLGGRAEVWQRKLAGNRFALLLFNNGMPPQTISCSSGCWERMGFGSKVVSVRDVLSHTYNGTTTGGYNAFVPTNGSALLVLSTH